MLTTNRSRVCHVMLMYQYTFIQVPPAYLRSNEDMRFLFKKQHITVRPGLFAPFGDIGASFYLTLFNFNANRIIPVSIRIMKEYQIDSFLSA